MGVPLVVTLICFVARLVSAVNVPDFDAKGYCKNTNDIVDFGIVDLQSNKSYEHCIDSEKESA
jgi:hypothetical protein